MLFYCHNCHPDSHPVGYIIKASTIPSKEMGSRDFYRAFPSKVMVDVTGSRWINPRNTFNVSSPWQYLQASIQLHPVNCLYPDFSKYCIASCKLWPALPAPCPATARRLEHVPPIPSCLVWSFSPIWLPMLYRPSTPNHHRVLVLADFTLWGTWAQFLLTKSAYPHLSYI